MRSIFVSVFKSSKSTGIECEVWFHRSILDSVLESKWSGYDNSLGNSTSSSSVQFMFTPLIVVILSKFTGWMSVFPSIVTAEIDGGFHKSYLGGRFSLSTQFQGTSQLGVSMSFSKASIRDKSLSFLWCYWYFLAFSTSILLTTKFSIGW